MHLFYILVALPVLVYPNLSEIDISTLMSCIELRIDLNPIYKAYIFLPKTKYFPFCLK